MFDPECEVCRALPVPSVAAIAFPTPHSERGWAVADRLRGILLGTAIGDALGGCAKRGEDVSAEPTGAGSLRTGGATQLTLFTLEGTVRMVGRAAAKGIGPAWSCVRHALDRWLWTQPGEDRLAIASRWAQGTSEGWPDGWLVTEHGLHGKRSDVAATRAALNRGRDPDFDEGRRIHGRPNRSDAAGALVRIAGAVAAVPLEVTFEAGARSAAATHGGPAGYLAPACGARIIAGLVAGESLSAAIRTTGEELAAWRGSESVRSALDAALALQPPDESLPKASLVLARALIAASSTPSDPIVILRGATSSGTATAVLTGQLVGAMAGASGLPAAWRVGPDLAPTIEELADAAGLAHRRWVLNEPIPTIEDGADSADESPLTTHLWPRYPGW